MPKAAEYGVENIQDFLESVLGLQGEARGEGAKAEYKIFCPDPNHQERHPSTDVNLSTGYWNCFSCGIGGDLVELAVKVSGDDRASVLEMMRPNSEDAIKVRITNRLRTLQETHFGKRKKKIKLPGPYEPGPHSYLRNRGFKQATIKRWGVRYVHDEQLKGKNGTFTIQHSIAIPIRDRYGNLLAWCYRATPDSPTWQQQNARYIYSDVEVSELWYGVQHHYGADEVAIVEGALDTMWLDQANIPALGLLGSAMGDAKILELQRYKRIYLMADRDDAGIKWVSRVGATIGHRMPVQICRYPSYTSATDPQELPPVDLELMLAKSVPWASWRSNVS